MNREVFFQVTHSQQRLALGVDGHLGIFFVDRGAHGALIWLAGNANLPAYENQKVSAHLDFTTLPSTDFRKSLGSALAPPGRGPVFSLVPSRTSSAYQHAEICPFSCRRSGGKSMHWSVANSQRERKRHPDGKSWGRGTMPGIT